MSLASLYNSGTVSTSCMIAHPRVQGGASCGGSAGQVARVHGPKALMAGWCSPALILAHSQIRVSGFRRLVAAGSADTRARSSLRFSGCLQMDITRTGLGGGPLSVLTDFNDIRQRQRVQARITPRRGPVARGPR